MGDMKRASMVWQGEGLAFKGVLGSGYTFDLVNPAGEAGGSPMEFLLAGVAGCTAMDVIHILRKKRLKVHGFAVEITGERAEEHPKVYTDVEITFVVRGEDIQPRDVEEAIRLSKDKYCSASAMFVRAGAEVHTSYRIEAPEAVSE